MKFTFHRQRNWNQYYFVQFCLFIREEKHPVSLKAKGIKQQKRQALLTNQILFLASNLAKCFLFKLFLTLPDYWCFCGCSDPFLTVLSQFLFFLPLLTEPETSTKLYSVKPLYPHMLEHWKATPTLLVTWSIKDPFSYQVTNIYLNVLKLFTPQNT